MLTFACSGYAKIDGISNVNNKQAFMQYLHHWFKIEKFVLLVFIHNMNSDSKSRGKFK